MSEATIRAAINTIVDGVSNVGQVHDYMRWATDRTALDAVFKTTISGTDQIRAWMITCTGWAQEQMEFRAASSKRGLRRDYIYKIIGIMGVDDSAATEKTFIAIVEDVVEALDVAQTIRAYRAPPAHLSAYEYRMVGGILCHYAEITQEVEEVQT